MIISIIATSQKMDSIGNLSARTGIAEQGIVKSNRQEKKPVIHVLKRYVPPANESQIPKKVVNAIF